MVRRCSSQRFSGNMISAKSTEWTRNPEAPYVHHCADEMVNGVEFHYTPDVGRTSRVKNIFVQLYVQAH